MCPARDKERPVVSIVAVFIALLVQHPPQSGQSDRRRHDSATFSFLFLDREDSRERNRVSGYLDVNGRSHAEYSSSFSTDVASGAAPHEALARISLLDGSNDTFAVNVAAADSMVPIHMVEGDGSTATPSLSVSRSTVNSTSLLTTVDTAILQRGQVHSLDVDDNIPSLPPQVHRCPFYFLQCPWIFFEASECYEHSLFHFYGYELPKQVNCPYPSCEQLEHKFADGSTAWAYRMAHVAQHCAKGEGLELSGRTAKLKEQRLFRHLWNQKIIDAAQLQELRKNGMLRIEPNAQATKLRQGKKKDEKTSKRNKVGASSS
ncbi:hypothetical protein NA57DRAFT_58705 [Rhizodiscina lignyota]|uniref:Uncharacterized protein n=1 Tax=Rhizodiscina lignyota TaxID=1504668 RepID=A0A9P4ICG0_9PEZI|nr:hypothetical protein NA57DRAFT_58705 [Rhizodiscina lignyota]